MEVPSDPAPLRMRWTALFAALVHVLLVVKIFGFSGILSQDPVMHGDWPIKFTESYLVAQGGEFPLKTWVYSPEHLAGYPAGVFTGVGTQSFDLILLATRDFLPAPVAFRLFLFLLFLLPPFLPAFAARWAGLSGASQSLAILLGVGLWQLESHTQFMWTFGTTAFLTGSMLSLCTAVGYGRMLGACAEGLHKTLGRGAAVGLLAGAATTFHPLCAFVLACACGWPILYGLVFLRWRFWLGHVPAGLVFLLISAHWLIPFFQLRPEAYTGGAPGPFETGVRYLLADALSDRSYRRPFDTTVFLQLVSLLALIGFASWRNSGFERRQWGLGLVGLLGISYLGSYVNFLAELQPYRFLAASLIFLLLPATIGLEKMIEQIRAIPRRLSIVPLLLAALVVPRFVPAGLQALSAPRFGGLHTDERQLYNWLGENTDRRSRILFDDRVVVLANLSPWYLHRETIGGPYDHVLLPHRYSMPGRKVATDPVDTWFGKRVDELNLTEVVERLNALNVEWFIVEVDSPGEVRAKKWAPALSRVVQIGKYVAYRNETCQRTFFLDGSGTVVSAPNELRLSGVSTGKVTLKYHYLSTLRAEPDIPLSKVAVLGDPVGFITFENPGHKEIVIRNTYR